MNLSFARRAPPLRAVPFGFELLRILPIALAGAAGYLLFPDDLAFLTRLISLILLVLSLDLVTGYCGIATLGHAALFGVAAYAAGTACIAGISDPVLLLGVGAAAGAVTGAVSGALITRFRGLPQLVLSIAIGQLVLASANKFSWISGGSDGLNGIAPSPLFGVFAFDLYSRTAYVLSLAVLAAVLIVLFQLVHSPFGLLCQAIRDESLRAKMIGVQVYPRLVVMYAISGVIAGLGGALAAMTAGVVGLDSVGFERSAEALVMLVLGGAGSLWGALTGAVLFQIFEHIVSAQNPFYWLMLVGLLLIAIVVFTPKGLVNPLLTWRRGTRKPAP